PAKRGRNPEPCSGPRILLRSIRASYQPSRPFHQRRQRGENRFDIAPGFEPEQRAAVMEQVELDVAAAAHQLLLALGFRPGLCPIAPDELRVDAQEGASDFPGEDKIRFPIAAVVPIVKNAADAARLVAVFEKKICIAPAL